MINTSYTVQVKLFGKLWFTMDTTKYVFKYCVTVIFFTASVWKRALNLAWMYSCRVPICRKRYATKKVQTHTHAHIYECMCVCVCVYYNRLVEKKQHSIFVTKQIEIVQSVRSPGHNVRDDRWSERARVAVFLTRVEHMSSLLTSA